VEAVSADLATDRMVVFATTDEQLTALVARERATRVRARDVLSTWCDMIPTWDPPASEGDP
jgi:hypothetical protein